jgi:hypothetical protein
MLPPGLEKLIEEAVVDAYTEEEQMIGFLTMMQEHLALPFAVNIVGVDLVSFAEGILRSNTRTRCSSPKLDLLQDSKQRKVCLESQRGVRRVTDF